MAIDLLHYHLPSPSPATPPTSAPTLHPPSIPCCPLDPPLPSSDLPHLIIPQKPQSMSDRHPLCSSSLNLDALMATLYSASPSFPAASSVKRAGHARFRSSAPVAHAPNPNRTVNCGSRREELKGTKEVEKQEQEQEECVRGRDSCVSETGVYSASGSGQHSRKFPQEEQEEEGTMNHLGLRLGIFNPAVYRGTHGRDSAKATSLTNPAITTEYGELTTLASNHPAMVKDAASAQAQSLPSTAKLMRDHGVFTNPAAKYTGPSQKLQSLTNLTANASNGITKREGTCASYDEDGGSIVDPSKRRPGSRSIGRPPLPPKRKCGMGEPEEARKCKSSRTCHCPSSRKPRVAASSGLSTPHRHDAFLWRKYGEKSIQGSPHRRSYYKCSSRSATGCPARKYVVRAKDAAEVLIVTYEGVHNH